MNKLSTEEIIVTAYAVKYHDIDYQDNYITITQNRTRRRVYNGWYFEDTGTYIYLSEYVVGFFQHKKKNRHFILNINTKEWRDYMSIIIEHYTPERIDPINNNEINDLRL